MFIDWHTISHLPVFTESGQKLGTIGEVEIDIDTHSIRKYVVKHGIIGKETFLIVPAQIRSITAEKIIVDDAIVKATEAGEAEAPPNPALGNLAP